MTRRRFATGAESVGSDGVSFRVWAPDHSSVSVVLEDPNGAHLSEFPLQRESDGYFSEVSRDARPGMRYRFRIDRAADTVPDPSSRDEPALGFGES